MIVGAAYLMPSSGEVAIIPIDADEQRQLCSGTASKVIIAGKVVIFLPLIASTTTVLSLSKTG